MPSPLARAGAALRSLLPDTYTMLLMATVLMASVLPCEGQSAVVFGKITTFAIGLLFFLHGAKLSREAIVSGLANWRLHLLVLASTFVMFPLLGLAMKPLATSMVPA